MSVLTTARLAPAVVVRRLALAPGLVGLVVAGALLAPIAAYAGYTRVSIESRVSMQAQQERIATARLAAQMFSDLLESNEGPLEGFANDPELVDAVRHDDRARLASLLQGLASTREFVTAGVVDGDGNILARLPSGGDQAPDYIAEVAKRASDLERGSSIFSIFSQSQHCCPGIVVVHPLDAGTRPLALYAQARPDVDRTLHELLPYGAPANGRTLMFLGPMGRYVLAGAMTDGTDVVPGDLSQLPNVAAARYVKEGSEVITIGGHDHFAVHELILSESWILYLFDDAEVARAMERRLTDPIAVGAIIAGALAIALAALVALLLARARRQQQQLAGLALSEERLRFARDLHDLLGHSLSTIAVKSELAARLAVPASDAVQESEDIARIARESLRDVREAVTGLRQPRLSEEIVAARSALKSAGIACAIEGDGAILPRHVDALFAWALRESVTNVIRHSGATRCRIRFIRGERETAVEITDDGGATTPPSFGSGLSGLAERAKAYGGVATASALKDHGFQVRVTVPLS